MLKSQFLKERKTNCFNRRWLMSPQFNKSIVWLKYVFIYASLSCANTYFQPTGRPINLGIFTICQKISAKYFAEILFSGFCQT